MRRPALAGLALAAAVVAACVAAWLALRPASVGAPDPESPDTAAGAAAVPVAHVPRRGRATDAPRRDVVIEIDDSAAPPDAAATVRGTVRDSGGNPVAGAHVQATVEGGRERAVVAESAADGRYELAGLALGVRWSLDAWADGMLASRTATAVLPSPRRTYLTYDLVLVKPGSIDVAVLDEDGAPVPDARWDVHPAGSAPNTWNVSPEALDPGRYRVSADAPGRGGERRVVDVAAGQALRVEFRLAPEAVVAGTVLDADGEALSRCVVEAVPAGGDEGTDSRWAKSDDEGRFRIRGLRAGRHTVRVSDWGVTADGPDVVDAPAEGVTLRVRRKARVVFRLVYPSDFSAADRSLEVIAWAVLHGHQYRVAPSFDDDAGRVTWPSGEDTVLVLDVPGCVQVRRPVRVRPGETLDLGDVALDAQQELVGRVVDALGAPLRGALVRGEFAGGEWQVATDAGGWFRLPRLPPGDGAVVAETPDHAPARVRCRAGQTEPVVVALARGGLLWLHVEGTAAAGAEVRLVGADGEPAPLLEPALDARGEFAARVAAGRWRIEVAGRAVAEAEVREGAVTSVRLAPR